MQNNRSVKLNFSFDVLLISIGLLIGVIEYFFQIFHGLLGVWIFLFIYFIIYGGFLKKFKIGSINKPGFIWLFIFVLIVFFNYTLRDTNPKSYKYFLNFFTFIILYLVDKTPIQYEKRITIFYIVLLGLGIQAMISIPYLLNEGGGFLIRKLSRGDLPPEKINELRRNGVGSNALYTSLSAYIIFGFFLVKRIKNKIPKIMLGAALCAMIITVLMSTFLASILMLVLGLMMIAVFRFKELFNFKNAIIILLLIGGTIYFIEEYLMKTRFLEPIVYKINAYSEGASSDVTGRNALAEVSWETFANNPLTGVGIPPMRSYSIIGEHMPWVDYLAHFGIIGYLPFLLFLFYRIKDRFRNQNIFEESNLYCLISIIICILSNFISPLFTTSIFSIGFIYLFTSNIFINKPL